MRDPRPRDAGADVDRLVRELASSGKYGHLCKATLARVVVWAAARSSRPREASRLARRKLHQIYGAYFRAGDHAALDRALAQLAADPSPGAIEACCRSVLALHASTRERLPILGDCFRALWTAIGGPASVADLACGLGPFALPWMGLPPHARYVALDIDCRLIEQVNRLLVLLGRPPLARCLDLLGDDPLPEAEVTLLLKALPSLERQERGAGGKLLRRVRSPIVVLSYPLRSLGGRDRGMATAYDREVRRLTGGAPLEVFAFPGEVFYVWRRG